MWNTVIIYLDENILLPRGDGSDGLIHVGVNECQFRQFTPCEC